MNNAPATYTGFGIRFQYPSNWVLLEEQTEGWPIGLTVQSPGTAFWSLNLYRKLLPPAALAQEVLAAMRSEYLDLEADPVTSRTGLDSDVAFDLNFYCLDRLVTGKIEIIDYQALTLVILAQAEDLEFEELKAVLAALTESLFIS
ncbi:MAG: hypothetical protein O2931_11135 [Planctomycetota bacterium]|nr:hypothetical protein [Planctomycetota bacterium]MDA1179338.1 hypothetical protein [Planctomycetota bacterium]